MTEFIILSRVDMLTLCDDKPVTVYIDKKPYVLCTDEYFEQQKKSHRKGSEAESLDYQRAVEDTEYCERYEQTYNSDDGSM